MACCQFDFPTGSIALGENRGRPRRRSGAPVVRIRVPMCNEFGGWRFVSSEVVRYQVDDKTVALFEIEPIDGFQPAGARDIAGRVREAAAPAIEAARELLVQVKDLAPDGVEVKFGIKVTGTANWLVAKAATEGNFEVTLTWQPANHGE
jgi:hypothetical protein